MPKKVIKLGILGAIVGITLGFSTGMVRAADIVYTSPQGSLIYDDGSIQFNGTDSQLNWSIASAGSSAFGSGASPLNFFRQAGDTFSTTTYVGQFGFSVGSGVPTEDYSVVDNQFVLINGVTVADHTTRVISFTPTGGTLVATGTNTVGFTAYISHDDFRTGEQFIFNVYPESCASGRLCSPTRFQVENPVAGLFSFSTTTDLETLGNTKMDVHFFNPQTGILGFFQGVFTDGPSAFLSSTSDWFIVGTTTAFDITQYSITNRIQELTSTTTADALKACVPLSGSFNIGNCITAIVWPDGKQVKDDILILKYTPPLGYVVRIIDIMNQTAATTSLPSINYTFASTSPMHVMGNIHFDPFGSVADASTLISSVTSDQSNHNVWDILMPVVKIFVYLVLVFMIVHDLTGIHAGSHNVPSKKDENKNQT